MAKAKRFVNKMQNRNNNLILVGKLPFMLLNEKAATSENNHILENGNILEITETFLRRFQINWKTESNLILTIQ